jgi:hypothetical protein
VFHRIPRLGLPQDPRRYNHRRQPSLFTTQAAAGEPLLGKVRPAVTGQIEYELCQSAGDAASVANCGREGKEEDCS